MRPKIILIITSFIIILFHSACSKKLPGMQNGTSSYSSQVSLAPIDAKNVIPGKIIIQFKPENTKSGDLNIASLQGLTRGLPLKQLKRLIPDNIVEKISAKQAMKGVVTRSQIEADQEYLKRQFLLEVATSSVESTIDLIKVLNKDSRIAYAEPDYKMKPSAVPNDTYYGNQWGMNKIQGPLAWDITPGDNQVIIAVIDTGIDYNHPDLVNNIAKYGPDLIGFDFVDNDNDPSPYNNDVYHGTHVAGIIGSYGNNSLGVTGVNWYVKIIPLRFINGATGEGSSSAAVQAIDYAISNGADIINASWGGTSAPTSLRDAIVRAKNAGILFIAAAGNEGNNNDSIPTYPASYDLANVISVGATDSNDNLASYSNYGVTVDLAAPGSNIYSTIPGGGYGYSDGTSMAAPYVTGVAGLIKSLHPDDDYSFLKTRLLSSVDKLISLSSINCRTWAGNVCQVASEGRINAYRAVYEQIDTENPVLALDNSFSASVPETLSGNVTLSGTASDNFAVSRVEVKVLKLQHLAKNILSPNPGDFDLFTAQGSSNWSYALDTTLLDNNYYYKLELRAYDPAGNSSSLVSATVLVSN